MGMLDFFKGKKEEVVITEGKIRPVVLLILDGYGLAPPSEGNAIELAKKPNIDGIYRTYPHGELHASGEVVGLPANEVGNTEVGHLNMGAGRTILQDLKRINRSIELNEFNDVRAFVHAVAHIQKTGGRMHLMGLVGSGNVHSSMNHLYALLDFCQKNGLKEVYLHLFTDGRDSPPTEGEGLIGQIEERLKNMGMGAIATVGGRYFGMDRDKRWERVEAAYKAMVLGRGEVANSAVEAVKNAYARNETDEFVKPTVIIKEGKPTAVVADGDAAIFFNFRIDRPRELTMALVMPDFERLKSFRFGYISDTEKAEGETTIKQTFNREKVVANLFLVTMTQYQEGLPVAEVAFPNEVVAKSLAVVIGESHLTQMHLSESEKERFVNYYFDGLREEKQAGEEVVVVPSPHVPTYDKKPEMAVFTLVDEFKKAMAADKYNFVVMNFANADMVAHTGNLQASIKAIEFVDRAIGEVEAMVLAKNGTLLITADHGNAEELLTYNSQGFFYTSKTGEKNTGHSSNLVPFLAINRVWQGKNVTLTRGTLGDVAPTVLGLLGVAVPAEMTGSNLLT